MALEMFKNGDTFDKIAEALGISRTTASRWVDSACEDESTRKKISINKKRHGVNKTKNNISSNGIKQEALKMLKAGMSYLEVAKKFDVSDNSIRKWVRSLGKNPKDYGHNKNNRKNNSGLKK
jgi:transposase-like protein